jgi:hypothetical protein
MHTHKLLCTQGGLVQYYICILLICFSNISTAKDLVLNQTSLGSLKLSKNSLISFQKIKKAFPGYNVTHKIASGDSPDFHRIEIQNNEKEQLFYIVSYFDEKTDKDTPQYNIDLLVITSSKIMDQYGIRIGDDVKKVIIKRGLNLLVSANHFDNSIGNDLIYYSVEVPLSTELKDKGIDYMSPVGVTKEQIILANPFVTSITWPYPGWD